ncbi:hypothetical protein L9F63_007980, partial [Diploptera punctata]
PLLTQLFGLQKHMLTSSNASTILFVVSASVLIRGLPGAIVICCCIFNAILTNDHEPPLLYSAASTLSN